MQALFRTAKAAALAAVAIKVASKAAEAVDAAWDRYVERK